MVEIGKAYSSLSLDLPCADIKIGTETSWQIKEDLSIDNIEISANIENEASYCRIELSKSLVDYSSSGKLEPGAEFKVVKQGESISVRLGYTDSNGINKFYDAFEGFIASATVTYCRDGAIVVLECLDAKMWMMAGAKFEIKKGDKYSGIVKDVLQTPYSGKIKKLNVKIDQEPKLNYKICQNNESDYQFLCRLGSATGCLFFVYLGEVYFISVGTYKGTVSLKISPCQFVEKLSWTSDVLGLFKQITVNGVDPGKPGSKVTSQAISKNVSNIGSGSISSQIAKNIDKSTEVDINISGADTSDYAKFLAQSKYTRNSINFVRCQVQIYGYVDGLKLGGGVKISGYGDSIDNNYILTSITHRFERESRKFETELGLATDACKKS